MRIVLLCGPPCSGKTTLAHHLAGPADRVIDYDDIARALGSPTLWRHPEPYRTQAETAMHHDMAQALRAPGQGIAYTLRTAPRPAQRQHLATQYRATVYVLNPGERECVRRARQDQRPSGTARAIGLWYHRYRPWRGDRDPRELDERFASVTASVLMVDPRAV